MSGNERAWIRRLTDLLPAPGDRVEQGIGDDMAVLHWSSNRMLLASDMLLDGVHFRLAEQGPAAVGRKAANCCLSDCAAMAAVPVAAVVSLALPRQSSGDLAADLLASMSDACRAFDCDIVGGDTTAWDGPLAIDVAITAQPGAPIAPVTRAGARPGDHLYVTGPLGASLEGRHLAFTPRITEAIEIARTLGDHLHAMIDITDGLAIDSDRLAEASGCSIVLLAEQLADVASTAARAIADAGGRDRVDQVLHDGEDFELLIAADCRPGQAEALGLQPVGEVQTGAGIRLRDQQGIETPLAPDGWQHF